MQREFNEIDHYYSKELSANCEHFDDVETLERRRQESANKTNIMVASSYSTPVILREPSQTKYRTATFGSFAGIKQ